MGQEAKILIVCTGNICRSPFIERLLQRRLDERRAGPERAIEVRSAGTSALAGWAMDEAAAEQLVAYGGDPAGFSARALTPDLIAESDLVLTATRTHRGSVSAMYPKALRRVFTFADFAVLVGEVDGLDAPVPNTDPQGWVAHVTEEAAAKRGLKPPLDPAQADIVDPFGRPDAVFAAMAQQVVASMPAVVRALAG
ncbi:MAG: low molecular weight phosphatase family protein [Dermatophilaceae bacterium]